MATVLVRFDSDEIAVVTGAIPPDTQTPISSPTQTGFVTNQAFIVAAGEYCYGLQNAGDYTPLWQVVQAVDGEQTEITFQSTGLRSSLATSGPTRKRRSAVRRRPAS